MKLNIDERIEHLKKINIMIACLSFIAMMLTNVFYPNLLSEVSVLCLVPFAIMFGWCIGLMDAQRNAED